MKFEFINKREYLQRIQEFQELFMYCFNKDVSKEFLIWRYIKNPLDDLLINVALDNNKIVANYSVSPYTIYIDGKLEKAALSMTTMTHPDYRGKGLFPKLATDLYKKMEEDNYIAVTGFPNNNSHSIFVEKLNWNNIYEIPTMKLDLSKINKSNIPISISVVNDSNFSFNYSKLINNKKNKIKVYKDLNYLKWRFKDNPANKYANYVILENNYVVSSIITKSFNNNETDIVEVNSLDDFYSKKLLEYIIDIDKGNGKKYINMWCHLNSNTHGMAEKIGFVNTEPISYFGVRCIKGNINGLRNYNNWDIQMGDSDVY
ncbi:GNAT family N-acetyltransferase [Clostridium beijerinckii]|uniref:GNAT family N-acetyltransferase n=1 Tax=Clostridium beijerinckii TaxID=1520 RepID=UPI00232B4405|nr:GNAT family N-acetyltransferase [Clostridium beijerinckii]